ncbi:hypothetical protein AA106555_0417 [Neokomagataea thailandica NBRC 106555]|uniref:Uncharacterized protein n=2 Tax=Neokomagataea TaxID=1223423 RepID=A0A4Y6VCJ5_9PROT|nr:MULTISPECIES: hypothetical protein [Neokomagataea]QDH26095.1 hypothetical protein D5366_11865 [Neokomagataea tanensis]GBR51036.1 hypothetical protein AA106555_0417 [Neokomagataea thailandica NBRC 106555]
MVIRIHDGEEASATRTPLEGGILGWAAVAMLGVCLVVIRVVPSNRASQVRRFAQIWAGGLFCFFAGVHRGASFYDAKGPQLSDPFIFLATHALGLGAILSSSNISWRALQVGALLNMAGDVRLARQGRLPRFLVRLRPAQLSTAFVLLILLEHSTPNHVLSSKSD